MGDVRLVMFVVVWVLGTKVSRCKTLTETHPFTVVVRQEAHAVCNGFSLWPFLTNITRNSFALTPFSEVIVCLSSLNASKNYRLLLCNPKL